MKEFDAGTLRNNLVKLMKLRKDTSNTNIQVTENSFNPKDLLHREIVHALSEDGEDIQWEGKILHHANSFFKVIKSQNCTA